MIVQNSAKKCVLRLKTAFFSIMWFTDAPSRKCDFQKSNLRFRRPWWVCFGFQTAHLAYRHFSHLTAALNILKKLKNAVFSPKTHLCALLCHLWGCVGSIIFAEKPELTLRTDFEQFYDKSSKWVVLLRVAQKFFLPETPSHEIAFFCNCQISFAGGTRKMMNG